MSKYGKPIWQYVLEAAKELKQKTFAPIDIIRKVHEKNPKIPSVTIRSYVIAMAPNHPSSKHHPSTRKLHCFFKYLGDGLFQLFPKKIEDKMEIEEEIEEGIEIEEGFEEAAISLERDLEQFIFDNIASVEEGFTPYQGESGKQRSVESGRIDILATDKEGNFVVIELKAGRATDAVLTQTLAYMSDITKSLTGEKNVRGIIIAHNFSSRLITAVSFLPNVELMKYKVKFEFEKIE